MTQPSAIVVGGGLAGLTAGYTLRKAGWRVTVVESGPCVGGRVQTVRRGGYVLDTGATQMSTGYREYLLLCEELGLRSSVSNSSSQVGLVRGGRLFIIDARSAFSALFSPVMSVRGKLAMLRTVWDFLRIQPRVDARDVSSSFAVDVESVAVYAERRVTREVYDALMDPLIRAYVMNRGSNVSVLEWFSTLRILSGQTMLSMNGGNDRLPSLLAAHSDVRLGCTALSIRRDADSVCVDVQGEGGKRDTLVAHACVLATRLPEALALYTPVRAAAGRLADMARYNRGLVVQLGYAHRPACAAVGLLLGAAEHDEIGLIWLEHNKNPDRAPGGHALYSLYFDEAVADRCYDSSDQTLIATAAAYIEALFPELKGAQDFSLVTRWPLAILNPAPGIYSAVNEMKARLDPQDPVQLAGDYFTCVGQNSAVYYGKLAAERLLRQVRPAHPKQAAA